MTKNEFKGFSSAAQHDMVLEALVRVTKNLEIIENEPGRPFTDTNGQRMNDIKLLTILADAFSKNELVWNKKAKSTRDDSKTIPNKQNKVYNTTDRMAGDEFLARGAALHTGIGQGVYMEKSKPAPWERMTLHEYIEEKFGKNNKES